MQDRDIVKHRKSGAVGVVLSTIHMLSEGGPWSVIFDGSTVAGVVGNEAEYEVIGRYDAVPDEHGCGMGKEKQCCRFLGVDRNGLTCLRFGVMHWDMVFKFTSDSKRNPNRLYPDCKLPQ